MSKKKKIIISLVTILVMAGILAGAVWGYLTHQKNSLTANVQTVESLNWFYGGNEMTSYGMVTNDYRQDVMLLDEQAISEVYVEEGQEVKAGDPLMAYDMTLTNLQLEMQELEVENTKNQLVLAQKELEKLKKETPVPDVPAMPVPEPEPMPQMPSAQIDNKSGAFHYLSGDTDTKKAKVKGKGTPEDPYVIYCMPGCYVEGGYLNHLAAQEKPVFVRLQIINPKTEEPKKKLYWDISSQSFGGMVFDALARWSVETKSPMEETDDLINDDFAEEDFGEDTWEEPKGYTAAELAAAIKQAEKNIKDLDLERRKAELQLEQMKKLTEDGTVLAELDGVVKTVEDKENPPQDGSAFITVSGSEGLYVTGSLSELQLGEVGIGQTVYANSWESGTSFEAVIQEISPYPTTSNNGWGEGNPNVSYYPYTAYIENTEGLKNGEYVELTMTAAFSQEDTTAIYLQKAYIREEDGRSYVLMADENNRLKKQYVETGRTIYGEAVEIKAGLQKEDRIAFPYGKTAREGIKAEDSSSGGMMYQ